MGLHSGLPTGKATESSPLLNSGPTITTGPLPSRVGTGHSEEGNDLLITKGIVHLKCHGPGGAAPLAMPRGANWSRAHLQLPCYRGQLRARRRAERMRDVISQSGGGGLTHPALGNVLASRNIRPQIVGGEQ
jgi:hypothetical protein